MMKEVNVRWYLMTDEKIKEPLVIRVKEKDLEDFNKLLDDNESPFNKSARKTVFLVAMAIGFHEMIKEELKDVKMIDYDRVAYLAPGEKALIKAIAVADKNDLQVLLNPKEVYLIAEEYAAGGIKILKNKVFSGEFGSYIKKLEAELVEKYKKISENSNSKKINYG